MQQLPLPAILRFNADRQRRAELGRENVQLARENARLRQVWVGGASALCGAAFGAQTDLVETHAYGKWVF